VAGSVAQKVRAQAGCYADLGWPVTPSCMCRALPIPEAHPANSRWLVEATTSHDDLDRQWEARPANGIIAALGTAVEALDVAGLDLRDCRARFEAAALTAPVLWESERRVAWENGVRRIVVLVRPATVGRVSAIRLPHLSVSVPRRRFTALPAWIGGQVRWSLQPGPLPPASAVLEALRA
jgi:hypothetical protein